MKYRIKKFITLLLIFITFLMFFEYPIVFARDSHETSNKPRELHRLEDGSYLRSFSQELKDKSNDELQGMIAQSQIESSRVIGNIAALKAAWLAAAEIARRNGYPLSATLVEHSVWNKSYSETNGPFAKAIRRTNKYNQMKKNRKGTIAFQKSDSSDLFYSLHKVSYSSASSSQGMRIWIRDVYDFEADTSYKNIFTSVVNNWAYLSQIMWMLHPVDVHLGIDV
ncbi:hypothetical protein SAMN05421839_11150 [Halolactibacillus halophilus]|uniref:Uncharacterized protein n=1 Tax=Halolactibacillus halophilus TaxID=306540 RepID=A0A1I5NVZ3_9BACI|nr:hypothetical protein [Halolactibacillus halophilus]GEM01466.1 hypothetical protein HHA03_09980 [Halolactibacillus halophilus]SFP25800.1 hypothetical protein SAMN05421839_11150 [Halolactibacillus halophilus]